MRSFSASRASARRLDRRRGGALLAVLWLAAALAAIAFSVAANVRAGAERSGAFAEGVQARYLAAGAIDRAILQQLSNPTLRSGGSGGAFAVRGQSIRLFEFPAGVSAVEIIPETARLSVNEARPDDLARLLLALGVPPAQAAETAAAIVDWRQPGGVSGFDQYYLSLTPSFRARHASIEEIEEMLFLKGMTPDVFYGAYTRDAGGRLVRLGGFRDCASPWGSVAQFDANTIEPALLLAFGAPPQGVEAIQRLRAERPLTAADLPLLRGLAGSAGPRLQSGGNTIFTFRATARIRNPQGVLSETRRTIAATVKFFTEVTPPATPGLPYQILRWNENATSEVAFWR